MCRGWKTRGSSVSILLVQHSGCRHPVLGQCQFDPASPVVVAQSPLPSPSLSLARQLQSSCIPSIVFHSNNSHPRPLSQLHSHQGHSRRRTPTHIKGHRDTQSTTPSLPSDPPSPIFRATHQQQCPPIRRTLSPSSPLMRRASRSRRRSPSAPSSSSR